MRARRILLLAGGATILGGIGLAFAGRSGGKRDPITTPLALPQNDAERQAVRTAVCNCHRGGSTGDGLLVCALKQVWQGVPWEQVVGKPPVPGDHPSVAQAVSLLAVELAEFESVPEHQRAAWCNLT